MLSTSLTILYQTSHVIHLPCLQVWLHCYKIKMQGIKKQYNKVTQVPCMFISYSP